MDDVIYSGTDREIKFRNATVYTSKGELRVLMLRLKPCFDELDHLEKIAPTGKERNAWLFGERRKVLKKHDVKGKVMDALKSVIFRRSEMAARELEKIARENLDYILMGVVENEDGEDR